MALLFESVTSDLFALLVVLVGYIYWYYSRAFKFWEERGVASTKPSFPAGNMGSIITLQEHSALLFKRLYDELKKTGPFAGFYIFARPGLLITDPEMIKIVLVRDFKYFPGRALYHNEKSEPLSENLLTTKGYKWKNLRIKLSPAFTFGKLKMMFPIMLHSSVNLTEYLKKQSVIEPEIEFKDALARFTMDVVGNCAFGLNCNSLKDQDGAFTKHTHMLLSPGFFQSLRNVVNTFFRQTATQLGLRAFDTRVSAFFMSVVKDVIEYREKNRVFRSDFMQILIELMKKPTDSLTFNEVAANSFMMFIGGFETSASTMTYACYELALHSEIQQRAREEIEEVLALHGGEITYESLHEMKYLELVIDETLRLHPVIPFLSREVAVDYTLPNTNVVVPAGTDVIISVLGLHRDPEYYPEPDRFDPERFTEENKSKRKPFTYLPFGEGPRICIAVRFGMLQTKLGLATILRDFKIERCPRTSIPLVYSTSAPFALTPNDVYLKLSSLLTKKDMQHTSL